jgi:hypothetical protein
MRLSEPYLHVVVFAVFCVAAFLVTTYLSPRLMLLPYKRGILSQGVDSGPIPVNTLYVQPERLFADPFAELPPGSTKLLSYGTNRDTLYAIGWLDLSRGPLVLHVPEMAGRYYSVQLTDASRNTNFAYVGSRTTGTEAGDYLLTGPRWTGEAPNGATTIVAPTNAVLVAARIFVADDQDLPAAHALAEQIRLTPLRP